MKGKLIVVEGLDGSGKATQAQLLQQQLTEQGIASQKISFPDYDSDSSALVKMYLGGEFGSHPDDVNPYAASTFFAVDRYASYKTSWQKLYQEGGVIVADRYTTSNAVHQCSKLPPQQWQRFLTWLFDFEYDKMGIPKPDAVIYLAVEPSVSQTLLEHRYNGDEERKDIHERDLDYLGRSRQAAEYCAKIFGWQRIECVQNGAMLPPEQINQLVCRMVRQTLGA